MAAKFPTAPAIWRRQWQQVIPFFDYLQPEARDYSEHLVGGGRSRLAPAK